MFEEKIITKCGYIETTLPFAYYNDLLNNINNYNFEEKFNYSLAGQIKEEKLFDNQYIPKEIKKIIIGGCEKYIETFGHSALFDKTNPNIKLNFLNSWINFQKKGEYNPIHYHSGDLVYVIWIKVPYDLMEEMNHPSSINSNAKCASCFSFANIVNPYSHFANMQINVDKSYEGKMIIFHARMEHLVYPFFTSDEYRISMSGNLSITFDEQKK